jgi:hypothetical protein
MSFNHTSAHHLPGLVNRRILHWTPGGHYRRWDPAKDGAPPPLPQAGKSNRGPVLPEQRPKPVTIKPWAATPAGMLRDARALLQSGSDEQQKRAFLEIDGAVELLLKGYITQPGSGRRLEGQYFPQWLAQAGAAAGDALKGIDLKDIAWYHGLRNKLQHDGGGITVERSTVVAYLGIAEALLIALNDAPPPPAVRPAR